MNRQFPFDNNLRQNTLRVKNKCKRDGNQNFKTFVTTVKRHSKLTVYT